jgi:hypothetical protein
MYSSFRCTCLSIRFSSLSTTDIIFVFLFLSVFFLHIIKDNDKDNLFMCDRFLTYFMGPEDSSESI